MNEQNRILELEHELEVTKAALFAEREERWHPICPPLFLETDINRIPIEYRRRIEAWNYGPKGLGLIGKADTGKTRAAFELLRRHHFLGFRCAEVSMVNFEKLILAADLPDKFFVQREKHKLSSNIFRASRFS